MQIKKCIALSIAGLLSFGPLAQESHARVNNHYAKWKFGQPFGYRDLKQSPGRWKVRSLSFHAGMDFNVAMGLHRIAAHAKAEGFEKVYIVSMQVTCSNLFGYAPRGCVGTALDEETDIRAAGIHPGDPQPPCEERGRWAVNCGEFEVDELLARLRIPLGLSATDDDVEVAELRSALLPSIR